MIHIHVFLLTATKKSDDNYTAVYTGAGTFAATALVAVIIVLAKTLHRKRKIGHREPH